MSEADVILQSYLIPLLTSFGALIFFGKFLGIFKSRVYTYTWTKYQNLYDEATDGLKEVMLTPLHDIVSYDWELRNKGLIRILEFGLRNGSNLIYYPKNCHLVGVFSKGISRKNFAKSAEQRSHVDLKQFHFHSAEDIEDIPANSMDAVVITTALCSVPDVDSLLQEIARVLAPGAKCFFLEHVHDDKSSIFRVLQSTLTVTGIWPYLRNGCHLNRNIEEHLKGIGFSKLETKRIDIDAKGSVFLELIKPHVMGIATK